MRRTLQELEEAEDFSMISCDWSAPADEHHRFRVAESDGCLWVPDGETWLRIPERHARTIAEFILEVLK
jgi:hypothetical protein